MKALEGYFDNLAAAAVNEKLVLENLVVNNTKLAVTTENLVAMEKNELTTSRTLNRKPPASRKADKAEGIRPSSTIARRNCVMRPRHATS